MNQHPLLIAMSRAGETTRVQAQFIQEYGNHGEEETGVALHMARLADAMVQDWTGVSSLNDRYVLDDLTHPGRRDARQRRELRVSIADLLLRFPSEYRVQIIDQLAAGNGEAEARALQLTADRQLQLMLAGIRANVEPTATAAS